MFPTRILVGEIIEDVSDEDSVSKNAKMLIPVQIKFQQIHRLDSID